MKFKRPKHYRGGALGELSKAIAEIQKSLEGIRELPGVHIQYENNSIAIGAYDQYDVGGTSPTWSGIVWFLGQVLHDFSGGAYGLIGYETPEEGDPIYRGSVEGEYLKIKLNDGSASWVDGPLDESELPETNIYEYFRVANKTATGYVLAENRTVGDIRISFAPYVAEVEEAI